VASEAHLYCPSCGSALSPEARFCTQCGEPQHVKEQPAASPAGQSVGSHLSGAAEEGVALAGIGLALPWQRVTGDERADPRAWLLEGVRPSTEWALGKSLARPGLALAATTVLEVAVAVITGGTAGLYKALPLLILGAATAALALVTASKSGSLRAATGVLASVTMVVLFGFAVNILVSGLDAGNSGWAVASQTVAVVSVLLTAAKTAVVALRRPNAPLRPK
jgi:hypothetical protein